MKIVYMGTPDFAVGALDRLYQEGHEILGVVTQPDKPQGRKMILTPPPVKVWAMEHQIPVLQPRRIREEESIRQVLALEPEVIVVAAFGQIIPQKLLTTPKYGCLNIHASLLPKYRGAAPIQWALIDGEEQTGVTIMQMDEGLDTGDILEQLVVPITPEDTGGSLFDKMAAAGAELICRVIPRLKAGDFTPQKQPEESPTAYAAMLKKDMARIDWSRSAAEIDRLIRGMNPWPVAFTALEGKTLKVFACRIEDKDREGIPGQLYDSLRDALLVQTGKGVLALTQLQLEGKKRMDAATFLRGYALKAGTLLGRQDTKTQQ